MRFLIADDSASIRALVRGVLEASYRRQDVVEVVEADNGMVALEALRAGVDIAIIDWGMPRLDGLDLVILARGEGITTPILMLTAFDDAGRERQARAAGVTDFVPKPFRIAELMERVRKLGG